jgi:hypothetical protein
MHEDLATLLCAPEKRAFLILPKKGVVPKENYCTHSDICLDTFCPSNQAPKNYLEAVLTLMNKSGSKTTGST